MSQTYEDWSAIFILCNSFLTLQVLFIFLLTIKLESTNAYYFWIVGNTTFTANTQAVIQSLCTVVAAVHKPTSSCGLCHQQKTKAEL